MNNLKRIALSITLGLTFTLAAENVHALATIDLKACKAVAVHSNDSSMEEHFKARLSLRGIHGAVQDTLVSQVPRLKLQRYVNILTECGLEQRAANRNNRPATIGKL